MYNLVINKIIINDDLLCALLRNWHFKFTREVIKIKIISYVIKISAMHMSHLQEN